MELLENVWGRARGAADRERKALEEYVAAGGAVLEGGIQPWDWRYYAEKVGESSIPPSTSSVIAPHRLLPLLTFTPPSTHYFTHRCVRRGTTLTSRP